MQETNNCWPLASDACVVIVGAGQAGGWAAHTLRKEGFGGSITLVGDESWQPYERPPLSKSILMGSAEPLSTHLFSDADWAALDINWISSRRVCSIDRQAHTLLLDDGSRLHWNRLILCTGGRSRTLTPDGMDETCETLRTLDDALRLRHRLRAAQRLLVIGGGWIGLEVAATARELGLDVTLVEAGDRLCARALPPNMSSWLKELHGRHGVRIMLNTAVSSACKQADGSFEVRLSPAGELGETLVVDLVIAGIGMIANDELASAAGLACTEGVVVDASCRTSDPDIFAAGDVAVSPNSWMGRRCRLESWQNAQEQGIAAARAVMGHAVLHDPIPWFWSEQFGVNLQIQGVVCDADQLVTREMAKASGDIRAIHFYLRAGHLRGVVGMNAAKEVRASKKLIATHASPDLAALADALVPLSQLG
ncbi:hypothetical protein B9Z36_02120 [Limnohabitans sp. Rim8]|uniref:NAD(P)/FAD-dependent oxidoreductase n=1 Tax=Limnohabitans sp. Rim8 TaxID=1100718 RepID=UPI000D354424|nr:FAD-dependent oxidoreductase [Limnohabitans sp. Rim8]PUE62126.1 hypothetical protein B9Z36_02120 [Limnohabitans sp. Rim8]